MAPIVDCLSCEARVRGEMLHQYLVSAEFAPSVRYTLAKCPQCESPLLTMESEGFNEWEPAERLYPPAESKLGDQVPGAIEHAFEEASRCYRTRSYTAAAMMCRRALESVVAEYTHGSAKTLAAGLKTMRDKGIIESGLYDWADALRIVGNEAAHGLDQPISAEDAHDALDFTRALIEYLFTYRDKFQEFMARRRQSASGGQ